MKALFTGLVFISLIILAGCASMWGQKEQELLNQGYTQEETDVMIAEMQSDTMIAVKDLIVDSSPISVPKELTDYWLEALGAVVGVGAAGVGYKKIKKSPEGKIFG